MNVRCSLEVKGFLWKFRRTNINRSKGRDLDLGGKNKP